VEDKVTLGQTKSDGAILQTVVSISPRRPGINAIPFQVGFVVNQVTLGQTKLDGAILQTVVRLSQRRLGINPLNAELNSICHLLALLVAHPILHVSRVRVNTIPFHVGFVVNEVAL